MSKIENYKLEVYLAINASHSEDATLAYIKEKINKISPHTQIGIADIKTFKNVNSWQEIPNNTMKKDNSKEDVEILHRFCELIRITDANNKVMKFINFHKSLDANSIKYIESKIQCHYKDMINYPQLLTNLICEDYEIISWGEHRVTIKFNDSKIIVRVEI